MSSQRLFGMVLMLVGVAFAVVVDSTGETWPRYVWPSAIVLGGFLTAGPLVLWTEDAEE